MRGFRQRGAETIEFALIQAGVMIPLMFAMIYTAELLWIWHSVNDFTRVGAQYASTHCWQASADNVVSYMRSQVPPMVDQEQFLTGQAEIVIEYFGRDPESGGLIEFTCEGGDCSAECVPDAVRVSVANYQFRYFVSYLGLPPVSIPNFQTTMPMESAGCDPEQSNCRA